MPSGQVAGWLVVGWLVVGWLVAGRWVAGWLVAGYPVAGRWVAGRWVAESLVAESLVAGCQFAGCPVVGCWFAESLVVGCQAAGHRVVVVKVAEKRGGFGEGDMAERAVHTVQGGWSSDSHLGRPADKTGGYLVILTDYITTSIEPQWRCCSITSFAITCSTCLLLDVDTLPVLLHYHSVLYRSSGGKTSITGVAGRTGLSSVVCLPLSASGGRGRVCRCGERRV